MKCPICNQGTLKKTTTKEEMFGVQLGEFPAHVCSSCNESFTDQETTRKIEDAAKAKGIWGLGKKTIIARTGNSLAVRIPTKIIHYLHIKEGSDVFVHPDKDKIVIECK